MQSIDLKGRSRFEVWVALNVREIGGTLVKSYPRMKRPWARGPRGNALSLVLRDNPGMTQFRGHHI